MGQRAEREAGAMVICGWQRRARAQAPRRLSRAAARTLVAAGLGCAMAGCAAGAAAPLPAAPVRVEVPLLRQVPCPLPRLAHPTLPLGALTAGSPPADTIRAYAASVAILKGAVREREALLAGCARAAATASTGKRR
ncbi:MAG TPA: hypothetical protein VFB33_05620 [Candidatus Binataceae bacterium]|nr:hypothetical protein [Candidatus Binataceae bacterium]